MGPHVGPSSTGLAPEAPAGQLGLPATPTTVSQDYVPVLAAREGPFRVGGPLDGARLSIGARPFVVIMPSDGRTERGG